MTQSDLTARIDEHLARPVRPPVYVEIVDPSGRVSYRRWSDHPDVLEALGTQGYTVRRCPQQPELDAQAEADKDSLTTAQESLPVAALDKQLREALAHYAEPRHYDHAGRLWSGDPDEHEDAQVDFGEIARAALAQAGGES